MQTSERPLGETPLSATAAQPEFRVVIAGGGVAALEAVIALSELGRSGLEIELICPDREFTYRAMSVAQPFGIKARPGLDLAAFCSEHGAELHPGRLAEVWPQQQRVLLDSGEEIFYDALLVALGAVPYDALPGTLNFRGPADVAPFGALLDELEGGEVRRLVFAVPAEVLWPLPLYELAMLTAHQLGERGVDGVDLSFVTHEPGPLEIFGSETSDHIVELLHRLGITTIVGRTPSRFEDGQLWLDDGSRLQAERVVSLPGLRVPLVPGLPHGSHGFIGANAEMAVDGLDRVWAAGDATWFPIKQGGLAAQQAEVAVAGIAAAAGVEVARTPFRPIIRGALLTGAEPEFMRKEVDGEAGADVATAPLWWPPAKVAGRRLAPYMARHWSQHGGDPLLPMEDLQAPESEGHDREVEHREALALSLRWADVDAHAGDYRQALRWLDVAEKLNLTLPRTYEERRGQWLERIGHPGYAAEDSER